MNDLIKNQDISRGKINIPKFNGNTKIELFENGTKVSEIVEKNMMTNYISEVLNPPLIWSNQSSLYDVIADRTPIYDKLLGGVLLYADPVEEETDNTRLSIANDCVGHAGGPYSGNNPKRGSYNTNESGYIDSENPWRGYRHVFDFGTDKANGLISCVCLTSKISGNSGYGGGIDYNVTENNNNLIYNQLRATPLGISGESGTIQNPRYLGNINSEDTFVYTTGNNLVVLRLPHDRAVLNLADSVDGTWIFNKLQSTSTRKIDVFPISDGTTMQFSVFVYENKCYIVNKPDSNTFSYVIFDPITNSFSARQNRTVAPEYRIDADVCYCDGYWFAHDNMLNLIRYPASGGQGETIDISNNTAILQPFGKDVVSFSESRAVAVNAETLKTYERTASYPSIGYRTYIQPLGNLALVFYVNKTNISLLAFDLIGGISTINNLATPVTKTEAQTMKITYEVTAEEA